MSTVSQKRIMHRLFVLLEKFLNVPLLSEIGIYTTSVIHWRYQPRKYRAIQASEPLSSQGVAAAVSEEYVIISDSTRCSCGKLCHFYWFLLFISDFLICILLLYMPKARVILLHDWIPNWFRQMYSVNSFGMPFMLRNAEKSWKSTCVKFSWGHERWGLYAVILKLFFIQTQLCKIKIQDERACCLLFLKLL